MADVTLVGTPSLATMLPPAGCQLTKEAAVDIDAGEMVYITSADKFDLADGSAADALAKWWGMAMRSAKAGQPLTAAHSCEFRYGSGMTPGASLYISVNAGLLADATSTGGDVACGVVTSATTVFIYQPRK